MARTSVKIGIIMLALWIIPVIGVALALTGLVIALVSHSNLKNDMSRAGIFLNSLGLGLALLNITVTFYLLITGDFDPARLLDQLEQLN